MATESRALVVLALIANGIIAVVKFQRAVPGATRIFIEPEASQ